MKNLVLGVLVPLPHLYPSLSSLSYLLNSYAVSPTRLTFLHLLLKQHVTYSDDGVPLIIIDCTNPFPNKWDAVQNVNKNRKQFFVSHLTKK